MLLRRYWQLLGFLRLTYRALRQGTALGLQNLSCQLLKLLVRKVGFRTGSLSLRCPSIGFCF